MADISSTISGQAGGAIGDDVQGGTTPLPPPPVIPSGEEMYDQIMSQIEPDLVTAQLPLLKEKYKDETPEQAKARADRYNAAFAEYDKRYAAYLQGQEGSLRNYQTQLNRSVEAYATENDGGQLSSIESAISNS